MYLYASIKRGNYLFKQRINAVTVLVHPTLLFPDHFIVPYKDFHFSAL